jgi:hypothetical protein
MLVLAQTHIQESGFEAFLGPALDVHFCWNLLHACPIPTTRTIIFALWALVFLLRDHLGMYVVASPT